MEPTCKISDGSTQVDPVTVHKEFEESKTVLENTRIIATDAVKKSDVQQKKSMASEADFIFRSSTTTPDVTSEADFQTRNIRSSTTTHKTVCTSNSSGVNGAASSNTASAGSELAVAHRADTYYVPPKQQIFDGRNSWESFILPFESMSRVYGWSEEEKLFRLRYSLREEAADFCFSYSVSGVHQSYDSLRESLQERFGEKRSSASYLSELENRVLRQNESLSEYVADVKRLVFKGYSTANEATRSTIELRHFLSGLKDKKMTIAVGMTNPTNIDIAVEIYKSLCYDFGREEPNSYNNYETEPIDYNVGVECYRCHEQGHFARVCPMKRRKSENQNDQF